MRKTVLLAACSFIFCAPAHSFDFGISGISGTFGVFGTKSPRPQDSISTYGNIFEYPHSSRYDIGCESCHFVCNPSLPPDWASFVPQDNDDTQHNNLCRHCHNDIVAPFVLTHSSLNTSNKFGTWSLECKVCHDPHVQYQKYAYGSESFRFQGTVTSVSGVDNSLRCAGAGWTDNAFQGLSVYPDVVQWPYRSFKILRNGSDTLYADGLDPTRVAAGSTFAVLRGKLVKDIVSTPSSGNKGVKFFQENGAHSFSDGDGVYDGVCEVCHTGTDHYRNNGSSDHSHMQGQKCSQCHMHKKGFRKGGGGGTHAVHDELISCDGGALGCHGAYTPPLFSDGQNLQNTARCDPCHSPGGSYDGVDDPEIGAKANWDNGVYGGGDLKAGKEKWCAGCHDEGPSVIGGVTAPNVVGDEDGFHPYGRGWGFYKTGHGLASGVYPASEGPAANLKCTACHDPAAPHIDNNYRTYSASGDNYQAAYRLKRPMDIPRLDNGEPVSDFQLCLDCHASTTYLTQTDNTTNFRDASSANSHWMHLQGPSSGLWSSNGLGVAWDSDWNGSQDSKINCPACHNVHGSPSPRMLRHGELISTPGTTDKVPSINVRYTPTTQPPYPTLDKSDGGWLNPAVSGQGSVANTGVCYMCHPNTITYVREITNVPPRIVSVHGRAGSNTLTVVFSEKVWTNANKSGALVPGDFAFTDADNGRTVTGVTHTAGDVTARLALSSALDSANDIGVDTLAAATAASIYDNKSAPMKTTPVVLSGEGPVTQTLHPGSKADNNAVFTVVGGQWPNVLDCFDGDISYARGSAMAGDLYYFTMEMDNTTALAPATIQSITIQVHARHTVGTTPYAAYVRVGYRTGTNLVWGTPYQTDTSGNWNLVSATYTTNSDGGPLTPADIDNLQVSVMRGNTNGNDSCITGVTEIKVDVTYLYPQ